MYSGKIWREIIFGSLADLSTYRQIKIHQLKMSSVRIYIRMTIPYHTAKLKSSNISESYIWEQTVKFSGYLVVLSLKLVQPFTNLQSDSVC